LFWVQRGTSIGLIEAIGRGGSAGGELKQELAGRGTERRMILDEFLYAKINRWTSKWTQKAAHTGSHARVPIVGYTAMMESAS
jgi:hypothetical protein